MSHYDAACGDGIYMRKIVFHIGHHKTATTWLQMKYFDSHPQLNLVSNFLTPWEDPFLSYLIGTSERKFDANTCIDMLEGTELEDDTNYVNVISAERLSGHPYSGGYDSYLIAERICRCFPDSKIIIVIRNQLDMLISMYQQLVREGYLGTFKNFINSKHWKGTSFSLDFLEYDLIVKKYQSMFTDDRVLVLLYEDMRADLVRYVGQISKFLGVDDYAVETGKKDRVNVSLRPNNIRAIRLVNQFKRSEFNPFPIFSMTSKFHHYFSKFLSFMVSSSAIIDGQDKTYIRDYYAESNSRLERILNRKLTGYL